MQNLIAPWWDQVDAEQKAIRSSKNILLCIFHKDLKIIRKGICFSRNILCKQIQLLKNYNLLGGKEVFALLDMTLAARVLKVEHKCPTRCLEIHLMTFGNPGPEGQMTEMGLVSWNMQIFLGTSFSLFWGVREAFFRGVWRFSEILVYFQKLWFIRGPGGNCNEII